LFVDVMLVQNLLSYTRTMKKHKFTYRAAWQYRKLGNHRVWIHLRTWGAINELRFLHDPTIPMEISIGASCSTLEQILVRHTILVSGRHISLLKKRRGNTSWRQISPRSVILIPSKSVAGRIAVNNANKTNIAIVLNISMNLPWAREGMGFKCWIGRRSTSINIRWRPPSRTLSRLGRRSTAWRWFPAAKTRKRSLAKWELVKSL